MTAEREAWHAKAGDLARWAWRRLVNRDDAFGGYRPPEEWGKEFRKADGTIGKLGQTTTVKRQLSIGRLLRHFKAQGRRDVIGLHSTNTANTCRWGICDIDWHGEGSTAPEINLRAALAWHGRLVRDGFNPLLLDSNNKGGFHLWIILAEPVPAPNLYYFLEQLVADHAAHGMAVAPEFFPKQRSLPQTDGQPNFGNWVRVPGRHHSHKYEHWTRVWSGNCWLVGAQAVAAILTHQGDPVNLVPETPPPPPVSPAPRQQYGHGTRYVTSGGKCNKSAIAAAYLRRLPNFGEGQGRSKTAFQFAAFLVRNLDIADPIALEWLRRWDAGNNPPLGEKDLADVLECAKKYGKSPIGCGLTPSNNRVFRKEVF